VVVVVAVVAVLPYAACCQVMFAPKKDVEDDGKGLNGAVSIGSRFADSFRLWSWLWASKAVFPLPFFCIPPTLLPTHPDTHARTRTHRMHPHRPSRCACPSASPPCLRASSASPATVRLPPAGLCGAAATKAGDVLQPPIHSQLARPRRTHRPSFRPLRFTLLRVVTHAHAHLAPCSHVNGASVTVMTATMVVVVVVVVVAGWGVIAMKN
jgi:hypothetical protein